MERVKTFPTTASGFLADRIVAAVINSRTRKMPGLTRGKSHEDLIRYLGAVTLVQAVSDWNAHEDFPPVAKHLRIDLSKLLPAAPPATVQTSAQDAADAEVRRENRRGNAKGRAIEKRRAKKAKAA